MSNKVKANFKVSHF